MHIKHSKEINLKLGKSVATGLGARRCQSGQGRCFEQPREGGPVVTCKKHAVERFWDEAAGSWQKQCPTCRAYKVWV